MHCIDIGIREEWYGSASGIISFRNNIVMALDSMELFIMIVYTQQICNISAFNIHVCETIVDQDQQRL